MADDADTASVKEELILDANVQAVLKAAARMPIGHPGDCRFCGEYSLRLVRCACARCRDRRGLP